MVAATPGGMENCSGAMMTPQTHQQNAHQQNARQQNDRRTRLIAILRDAPWLTHERALAWCQVLAVVGVAFTALRWVLAAFGILLYGDPRNVDFVSFWTASELALRGQPHFAYEPMLHQRAEQTLLGSITGYTAFFYPPPYLLLCLPLALLPFVPALFLWLGLSWAAFWRVARRFLPICISTGTGLLVLIGYPAALNNVWHGQNGFVFTALFGAGVLTLDRRPFVAGLWFGCLVGKPQLALLLVPALLLAGRWWTILGAGVSALGLAGAAMLAFGLNTWQAFLADTALARTALEQELIGSAKLQSVFAAVRLLGGGLPLAYGLQIAVALAVLTLVLVLVRRRPGGLAEGVAIAAATPLISPFILDYDLVLLALPIGWVMQQAQRTGAFLPWEKLALAAAFMLALISRTIAMKFGLPLAPLVLVAFLLVVARRVRFLPPG